MTVTVKTVSPLLKLTQNDTVKMQEAKALKRTVALRGERVSLQVALSSDTKLHSKVWAEFDAADAVRIYREKDVVVDLPAREPVLDENYLLTSAGYLPDPLTPIEQQNSMVYLSPLVAMLWVNVDIPTDIPSGEHILKIFVGVEPDHSGVGITETFSAEICIQVVDTLLPEQKFIYTRWIYLDCIANAHNVKIFSEEHWELIESYIATAADMGINMLLVPVHTPPLDTEIGTRRPCVQLVDIEKSGNKYSFDFKKLHRYIELCKKYGIKYYEMAHMFSQWGAKCAPNIMVTENGVTDYMFGWHIAANDPRYVEFLRQYIAAISREMQAEGIAENTYFHISDEPHPDNLPRYEEALNIFKPLIGDCKIFDALSHFEFYEKGLVDCPVTSVTHIHEFLEHPIENQWVYYCCGPERVFTNSFIALPSARVRVLGFLCYKYDIKGFLHWGYNYYNSSLSRYPINPYVTTSADGCYPSGDGFIAYPGLSGALPSVRGYVTAAAMSDMRVCSALEAKIGREAVVAMIDAAAGRDLRFDDYPCDDDFLEDLRAAMVERLAR